MLLDSLTACVTTFRRPDWLAKCIESVKAARITNIVVADGEECGSDIGCNNTWLTAAYRAKTKRVLLLHEDDSLSPDFGQVYETIIAPCLDKRDAGFASWDAETLFEDGHTEPCPYWQGSKNLVLPSKQFEKCILSGGNLTHSPAVSVFNRTILIRACKEAAERLISNVSLERPGMIYGTELLVYLRHCQAFKRWLHVPKVLSYYGSHAGSGTVKAQRGGYVEKLTKGYELARNYGRLPPPIPTPRLLLVHSVYQPKDPETIERMKAAQKSWAFHFATGEVLDFPYYAKSMPKITEVLDYAAQFALPEDIIVYANEDAGLTTHAVERIIAGIDKGRGVTCCGNRNMETGTERLYKNLTNLRSPGGTEVIAMTPAWWKVHREKMPEMFIGREGWDSVFNALAEEWADGAKEVTTDPDDWLRSRAHTDNVCWHVDHFSEWQKDRLGQRGKPMSESQKFNRDVARDFFLKRADHKMLDMLK